MLHVSFLGIQVLHLWSPSAPLSPALVLPVDARASAVAVARDGASAGTSGRGPRRKRLPRAGPARPGPGKRSSCGNPVRRRPRRRRSTATRRCWLGRGQRHAVARCAGQPAHRRARTARVSRRIRGATFARPRVIYLTRAARKRTQITRRAAAGVLAAAAAPPNVPTAAWSRQRSVL